MALIHTRASKRRDRAEAGLARAETKLIRAEAKTARQQEAQAAPADQPWVMAIPEGFFGASAKPKTFHENNLAAKMTFQA